jgi:cytochrome P450
MSVVPSYPGELFTDDAILQPYEQYRELRELGPVVWLEPQQMYVLSRYAEVRAALADPDVFCSGRGVGMNDVANTVGLGTTLMSDGDVHDLQRAILAHRLTPRGLRPIHEAVQDAADALVQQLVGEREFDAVHDLARTLPMSVVPDLVGWPVHGRDNLLDWSAATFDILGPMNARAEHAGPRIVAMFQFAAHTVASRDVLPGSAAADMLGEVDGGKLTENQAASLIIDYLGPSLDTTISAIASSVWLFGRHPDQWNLLRERPDLVGNAFNEVIRLESPIRAFTRVLTVGTTISGHELPAGARVMVLFASANRDELRWERADEFDITRNANGQLGFGYGIHGCAGQGLARLEGQSVLRALVDRVERFELGTETWALNNLIRSLGSLPVTVTAVSTRSTSNAAPAAGRG